MTKQTINVGTSPNDNRGDSLRASFQKINANFTELYTALGINADVNLNLGAFEFAGSVLSTTDSSAIVIDQAVTVSSNLTVGGDVLPSVANGGDLGSSARPWKSLYISNNTIYIGGVALGLDANGNLTTGGTVVGSTPAWDTITGKPTFATVATTGAYADLAGNPTIPTSFSSLVNGAHQLVLNVGGAGPYITFPSDDGASISIQGCDISGAGFEVNLLSAEDGVRLSANAASDRKDWLFGTDGILTLPDDSSIKSATNIDITVDTPDSSTFNWRFGADGNLTLPQGGNISEGGGISGAIKLTPSGGANAYQALMIYPTAGEGDHIHLTAGGGTTELYLGDDLHYVKLESDGNIRIQADNGVNGAAWTFGTDGSLQIPGDIRSEGNINIEINLADSTLRRWQFGEDGKLTFPDGTNYAGKDITLPQTYGGVASKVSWNFSDIVFGNSTTFLEWNLLSTDMGEFLIGTTNIANPFYFSFDGTGQTLGTIDNGGIVGGGKLTFGSTAGSNAGDVNAIELKATNGDVYLTSTESVKITVDASDSSARVWLFDPTGNLTFPDATVQTTAYRGLTPNGTKASTDTGTAGQTSYDSQYFYICVATNSWRRMALGSY